MVAQDQRVLPKGKPSSRDQGNASNGHIPDRLGSRHDWPPCPRSMEWSSCHLAHQLPGDAGRVSSTQTLSSGPNKSPCVSTHRQHSGGFLYKPPGMSAFAPHIQAAHQILVWSQHKFLSQRAVYIPGADILSRQGPGPGEWRLHLKVKTLYHNVFLP